MTNKCDKTKNLLQTEVANQTRQRDKKKYKDIFKMELQINLANH